MDKTILGKTFDSAQEMQSFFKNLQIESEKELSMTGTHKLPENNDLKYHSLKYVCACYGTPRNEKENPKRPSKKCGCPVFYKIGLSPKKKHLVIRNVSEESHNKKCDELNTKFVKTKKNDSKSVPNKETTEKCPKHTSETKVTQSTEAILEESVEKLFEEPFVSSSDYESDKNNYVATEKVSENMCEMLEQDIKSKSVERFDNLYDNLNVDSLIDIFDDQSIVETNVRPCNVEDIVDFKISDISADKTNTTLQVLDNAATVPDKDESLLQKSSSSDIVFDSQLKKNKGRPVGSKKIKASGVSLQPKCTSYLKKTSIQKVKMLLKFLVDRHTIQNALEGSYKIDIADIKNIDETKLNDIFKNENVKISILQNYMTTLAFNHLQSIVAKQDDYFECYLCEKEADDGTVECESCFNWIHFSCANINEKKFNSKQIFFCPKCSA